jgi:hypothetical protein
MSEATVPSLVERVAALNPFLDNRVNGPAPAEVDVPEVHQAAFERLVDQAREAHAANRAVGAVLWGEAGIGKSHVLARLGRWADAGNAVFVYLHNLQAHPDHLPRALLHGVVSLLTLGRRDRLATTPLYALARAGVLASVDGRLGHYAWWQAEAAWSGFVDELGAEGGASALDRAVWDVFFALFRSATRAALGKEDGSTAALAVRWLSGRGLEADEGRRLGLPPARGHEAVALEDEQQVKQVMLALARLASCKGQPFVLALDQVDNLEPAQFAALARFLESVLDSARNLLVVTAGIQPTLMQWRQEGVIQASGWDRVGQTEVRLERLRATEAERLVLARLDAFFVPFAGLDELARARQASPFFPLGHSWYERSLRDRVDLRPRDVINGAREAWRQEQRRLAELGGDAWLEGWAGRPDEPLPEQSPVEATPEAIDAAVEAALAEERALLTQPGRLPQDEGRLAEALFALLSDCREGGELHGVLDVERTLPKYQSTRRTYDLILRRRGAGQPSAVRVAALVLLEENKTSVAGYLRRLSKDSRAVDLCVLITDERVKLPVGEVGQELLEELQRQGPERFHHVEVSEAEWAELLALQAVARNAELEVEVGPGRARPLTRPEVIASHERRGRYLACRLLRVLLGLEAAEAGPGEAAARQGA